MKVRKRPLIPERLRRPPKEGWSWIDRRFLREYAPRLERDAILLYFFLAAVSDKDGLSYYADTSLTAQLRITAASLARSRDELERYDLIAYEHPLYQVLALPSGSRRRSQSSGPTLLAEILGALGPGHPTPAVAPAGRRPWKQK